MNKLSGHIDTVDVKGNLSLVRTRVTDALFTAIVIGTPEEVPFLKKGHPVQVLFKETEVIICTEPEYRISLRNRLACRIEAIDQGELLSKVSMSHPAGAVESIITTNAVRHLELKPGKEVWAMIKTNEIMLSE